MGRGRKSGVKIHGWINLHKPVGVTSTQAVGKVRRALNANKIGHGGTLDPLASGILPLALGEATKTVNYAQDAIKVYHFTTTWGEQRTTDDAEGDVIHSSDTRSKQEQIESLLPEFIGEIEQTPPQFSAIKIDGERAYDLARDGQTVEIKSRIVEIDNLTILSHNDQETAFECVCGKGTYIRSIARDLGEKLGCYGYVSALKRTKVGAFEINDAISLDFFEQMGDKTALEDVILPLQTALDDIPVLALKEQEAVALKHGRSLSLMAKSDLERLTAIDIDWKSNDETTALVTYEDKALALVTIYGAEIKPLRVFNL